LTDPSQGERPKKKRSNTEGRVGTKKRKRKLQYARKVSPKRLLEPTFIYSFRLSSRKGGPYRKRGRVRIGEGSRKGRIENVRYSLEGVHAGEHEKLSERKDTLYEAKSEREHEELARNWGEGPALEIARLKDPGRGSAEVREREAIKDGSRGEKQYLPYACADRGRYTVTQGGTTAKEGLEKRGRGPSVKRVGRLNSLGAVSLPESYPKEVKKAYFV